MSRDAVEDEDGPATDRWPTGGVDAARVAAWFAESMEPAKGQVSKSIPDNQSPFISEIAEYANRMQLIYRVEITAKMEAELIEFEKRFTFFMRNLRDLDTSAKSLIKLCDQEQDYELFDKLWSLIKKIETDWIKDRPPEWLKRSTWHVWAWTLREMALSAWAEVNFHPTKINRNNPMTRFLMLALYEIDGVERSADTIAKALADMAKKRSPRRRRGNKPH